MEVPTQDVTTRDSVSIKVTTVFYFRVVHPELAATEAEHHVNGTAEIVQATVREVCGQVEYKKLFSNCERINRQLQGLSDLHTDPWGIKVRAVEIKQIDRV
jgi:regulator of protease activity HflC (stomatin/prohibitin superfamily)